MSGFAEYDQYDGMGLAELVRRREVSPDEVLEAAIARVEAHNPAINAVVSRLYDEARAARRAGLPAGPFTGAPYLLKDLGALDTGAITSCGSRFFAADRADHDSELTARLKRAGLVIFGSIGKSNGLFHRRRAPCRPPRATGRSLPAVLPSARPARPPGRALACSPRRAAGAGSRRRPSAIRRRPPSERRLGDWLSTLRSANAEGCETDAHA